MKNVNSQEVVSQNPKEASENLKTTTNAENQNHDLAFLLTLLVIIFSAVAFLFQIFGKLNSSHPQLVDKFWPILACLIILFIYCGMRVFVNLLIRLYKKEHSRSSLLSSLNNSGSPFGFGIAAALLYTVILMTIPLIGFLLVSSDLVLPPLFSFFFVCLTLFDLIIFQYTSKMWRDLFEAYRETKKLMVLCQLATLFLFLVYLFLLIPLAALLIIVAVQIIRRRVISRMWEKITNTLKSKDRHVISLARMWEKITNTFKFEYAGYFLCLLFAVHITINTALYFAGDFDVEFDKTHYIKNEDDVFLQIHPSGISEPRLHQITYLNHLILNRTENQRSPAYVKINSSILTNESNSSFIVLKSTFGSSCFALPKWPLFNDICARVFPEPPATQREIPVPVFQR